MGKGGVVRKLFFYWWNFGREYVRFENVVKWKVFCYGIGENVIVIVKFI